MGRLTTLKPRLKTIGSRLAREEGEAARHAERDRTQSWRRWYKTSRWQRLRWKVLVRDLFTCQMEGCGLVEPQTSQLVADHKIRHRGDERLFWDEGNLQCLCKRCHDKLKQRQERAAG